MSRRPPMPKGRIELLNWMNEFLESDYTKVEQACDGVAYAQIIDCACGLKMPLHRFNFAARNEDDNERNLTVLQMEFKKLDIDHPVPTERLAKGRFQDNNEFLQWCFTFLHNCVEDQHDYPAIKRRQEALHKQVKLRGRNTLPPPCVKTELAYGIDLDAPPPEPARQAQLEPQQMWPRGGPEVGYDPSVYERGVPAGASWGHVGGHDDGGGGDGGGDMHRGGGDQGDLVPEEDLPIIQLGTQLTHELQQARVEHTRRRKDLEALAKERNSMWQQLRTVCLGLVQFFFFDTHSSSYFIYRLRSFSEISTG